MSAVFSFIPTFLPPALRGAARKEKGGSPEDARRSDENMLNVLEDTTKGNDRAVKDTFVSSAEFEKKLRWLVTNPPRDTEKWRITPKMAEIMLGWNNRNRPVSASTVKKYAEAMREGRWRYTGVPIVFSTHRLLDGQNRLMACVESGQSIEALVVFGVPDDSFAFIDVGKTRSASNVFAIHGVKNFSIMAAAIQWVIGYEDNKVSAGAKGVMGMDHAQLYEAYLEHPALQDSAWVAHLFAPAKIISPSMMCAIHYFCAKKSRSDADAFFRKVGEGIGFSGKKDPAYKLHKFLVDAAVSQQRPGRTAGAALTVKAWNASRLNRDVGALRFSADEAFPRII